MMFSNSNTSMQSVLVSGCQDKKGHGTRLRSRKFLKRQLDSKQTDSKQNRIARFVSSRALQKPFSRYHVIRNEQHDPNSSQNSSYRNPNSLSGEYIMIAKNGQSHHCRRQTTISSLCLLLFAIMLVAEIKCIVVHQMKSISINSKRTDYVISGESMELSCHYTMKDDAEDIRQVIWSKDGRNFLRWRKNKPGLEVLSYTYKGHLDQTSVFSRLLIHNVTIAMHGKYMCSIKTDLGTHSGEHDLVVISSQQCKLNDWKILSEQSKCREIFRFDCRNMFPKPVPSCGLWDDKLNKFIRSVSIDINEENTRQQTTSPNETKTASTHSTGARETFRIRYLDKYALKFPNGSTNPQFRDLLDYAGHLVFKCDILVPETKWNISLSHKMFNFQDGCNVDPLDAIEQMRLNFSHYAAQRMQQAGRRPLAGRQQNEDIEMLTTSLKYEIIPPSSGDINNLLERSPRMQNASSDIRSRNDPHPKVDNNLDLNCWQRPRVGSFARLSCANQRKNQVKLIGANLLECRPQGWIPVRSSGTNFGEPTIVRKQQAAEKRLSAIASSRRPTRAERPDGQVVNSAGGNPNRDEGSIDVVVEDDDGDETSSGNNAKSSNDARESTRTSTVQVTDKLEERVRLENEIRLKASEFEQLTPAELAALLPACVSIAPPKPKKQQSKLPIIEASSVRNKKLLNSKSGDDNWGWYIFSRSSSISLQPNAGYQYLIIILVAFKLRAVMLSITCLAY